MQDARTVLHRQVRNEASRARITRRCYFCKNRRAIIKLQMPSKHIRPACAPCLKLRGPSAVAAFVYHQDQQ